MISMNPIVNWRDVVSALVPCNEDYESDLSTVPWIKQDHLTFWFSSSLWSLFVICKWQKILYNHNKVFLWIPDYFCNQSLIKVRETGVEIVFYPVTEEMTPDWERCEKIASQKKPQLFLLVHYFGIVNDIKGTKAFCKHHAAIFIEDCAHGLIPGDEMGKDGDFIIYSPHKLLALPDGALLLANRRKLGKYLEKNEDFKKSFNMVLSSLPKGQNNYGKWLTKQIAKKIIHAYVIAAIKNIISDINKREMDVSISMEVSLPEQSNISKRLIMRQLGRLEAYGWYRSVNAIILEYNLKKMKVKKIIRPKLGKGFPYIIGLRFINSREAFDFRKKAIKYGALANTWPDLSPEVLEESLYHQTAIRIQQETVFLPVHQNISAKKLLRYLRVKTRKTKFSIKNLMVKWDLGENEWKRLYNDAPKAELLQSWAYMSAKKEAERYSAKIGLLESNDKPIGIFIVLEKRGPFGMCLARLNRGPVWLSDEIEPFKKIESINLILKEYMLLKGKTLFFAPNIDMSEYAIEKMNILGVHRRMKRPWASIRIDLKEDEVILKKKLNGKWRNQLRFAEKKGLEYSIDEKDSTINWMLRRYKELMKEKDFEGPSTSFIQKLRKTLILSGEHFYVLQAHINKETVGAIALVTHGSSATYLLGWNGENGRHLNANNFLLWQGMLYLKKEGIKCFDLGGINEWGTPGITKFKRGLGGQEYRLVGEYSNFPL